MRAGRGNDERKAAGAVLLLLACLLEFPILLLGALRAVHIVRIELFVLLLLVLR